MKSGTIVSINGWHDLLPGGAENYGIITKVDPVTRETCTVCMVRGPSEGQLIDIAISALKVEEALPTADRESRLDRAVRIAKLTFMSYQLQHEKKRGQDDDKALANAALVDMMNEALRP